VQAILDIFPILTLFSCAGSVSVFAYLYITERKAPKFDFQPGSVGNGSSSPKVSVIVTAKNEEQMIRQCIESLLAQTYENLEIIVVDDASTDRTREVVIELAPKSGKLRLVLAGPKPDGWVGKSWPCWRGFQEAGGEFLLFVDADSTFERSVVGRSIEYSLHYSIDMFSLAPRVKIVGIWAYSVLPLITGAINLLYPMIKVNEKLSKRAYVFGTYFLVRRDVYEATGGHSKVRDQLVEDAAVAQLVKSAGYNLRIERGSELLTTEWERDPKAIFHGLERITSSSIRTYGLISILNAALLFFLIVYPVIFIVAILLLKIFSPIFLLGLIVSVSDVVVVLLLTARELQADSGKAGPAIVLCFLGALLFIAAIVTTSVKVARGKDLFWKGQGYKQAVRGPLEPSEGSR
jgi:chlorobactene glucosyltransferase